MEAFYKKQNFTPEENTGVLEGEFIDYMADKYQLIFSELQGNALLEQRNDSYKIANIQEVYNEDFSIKTRSIFLGEKVIGTMVLTKNEDHTRDFEVKEIL